MLVEQAGKPAVVVITEEFVAIATQIAREQEHPDLRQLVLPYPLEARPADEVRAIAVDAYPRLLKLLGVAE